MRLVCALSLASHSIHCLVGSQDCGSSQNSKKSCVLGYVPLCHIMPRRESHGEVGPPRRVAERLGVEMVLVEMPWWGLREARPLDGKILHERQITNKNYATIEYEE